MIFSLLFPIFNLRLDLDVARAEGNTREVKLLEAKIYKLKHESCTPKLSEAIEKAEADNSTVSPFEDAEFTSSYFVATLLHPPTTIF